MRFYQPKWISTHYTLLDLKNIGISPSIKEVNEALKIVLNENKAEDGGIKLGPSTSVHSDVCVNGMFLNYASYFNVEEKRLAAVVDAILNEKMKDGGFNCRTTRSGATHSSLHTTISVLEGLHEFQKKGHKYRSKDISKARKDAQEFILMHQLFISDKTGKIIHKDFLKLPYPSRWKYDILRCLDHFQNANVKWDKRMKPAIEALVSKRTKDGLWKVQSAHPGEVHFVMEKAGKPSRINTLRALRVLKYYGIE